MQRGDAELLVWMQLLRDYAKDWDRTFDNRAGYFTQEYWYLFVGCLLRYWNDSPATVSEACQLMLTGSNRTREGRIQRAVSDGYLLKQRGNDDERTVRIIPSPRLEKLMREHFARTLRESREAVLATPPGRASTTPRVRVRHRK